ncbi:MAG: copper resistance CopC/CopD family protein [Solirubrobacterales bacterium]
MSAHRVGVALVLSALIALAGASAASAHAQLLETTPVSDATLPTQPPKVVFKFNQAVGGTLGAVRVYDAQGNEVDDLDVSHPEGREHWMGVGLKAHLPDGTYTATYRVISADTHIVYGGLVFNIGHAGAAPRFTVAGLIARNESGEATKLAFGLMRALDYLSIALLLGGLAFLLVAWFPGLMAVAGAEQRWVEASRAFARGLQRQLLVAIALGVVVSVLGILLQGASAAGVSLWSSLRSAVIENTLESRFGEVWGWRAIDWLAIGALLAMARALRRDLVPTLQPAGAGAGALTSRPPRLLLALVGIGAAYLAITPALAGHASTQSPTAAFFPSDAVHVLAASVWVGGIACLLAALPAATRRLEGPERSRLLLAVLKRFSPLALGAVVAIAITGVVQAYIDVRSLHALLHTTYGALVLVKTALLLCLIGFGWINRARMIPALQRIVDAERAPGGVGVRARRSLRGEMALMLCVFGVTGALVGYTPPIDAASGPFSANTTLGPAELELTVEPARTGPNTIHLYLIDAKDGTQFTATKELTARATLPAKGIGPLPLRANLSGPGHYTLNSVELSPGGTWDIEINDRVSEFEQYSRTVEVPIR